jgi:polysaccharide biosynthesis transport protein
MSLVQFLTIIWAWRWPIAVAAMSCLAGAAAVVLVVPPRWEAHSRVVLDLVKPDPLTGQTIAGGDASSYIATQVELITDYTVATRVVDQMGWLSDPTLIRNYKQQPSGEAQGFRRWLAQRVIKHTKAQVLEGSNILEITYRASSPDSARQGADAIRKAYLDASLDFRRDAANRDANWFGAQAEQLKAQLDVAQSAATAFERENGIIMQDDKTDVDTARLRAIAAQGAGVGPVVSAAPVSSPASIQLAQVDAQIAQTSQTLGPNNPQLQQLRAQRASLAALVAQDQAAARAVAAAAAGGAGAIDRAMASEKSRVIAQSDKLETLTQLESQVNILTDQYNRNAAKAADLRQQAAVVDTGLAALGPTDTPNAPVFPNLLLIFPGALVLGLGAGVLVALLAELLNRRVRGIEDLTSAVEAPLLGVIGSPGKKQSPASPLSPRRWLALPGSRGRRSVARA